VPHIAGRIERADKRSPQVSAAALLVVCLIPYRRSTLRSTMSKLSAARYGKSNVRVLRVVRDAGEGKEDVVEYNVQLLVEGKIETRYGCPVHSVPT